MYRFGFDENGMQPTGICSISPEALDPSMLASIKYPSSPTLGWLVGVEGWRDEGISHRSEPGDKMWEMSAMVAILGGRVRSFGRAVL